MKSSWTALSFASLSALTLSCSSNPREVSSSSAGPTAYAVADLQSRSGSQAAGRVEFYETDKGINVVAKVESTTEGEHGFHIHEKGDCSDPNAASAGGHYNPTRTKHAGPTDKHRHLGDLGNIIATSRGMGALEVLIPRASFSKLPEGPRAIIGKSVVLHAGRDDLKSQPAGNSGDRIACGVIVAAP